MYSYAHMPPDIFISDHAVCWFSTLQGEHVLPLQSAEAACRRIGIEHAFNDPQVIQDLRNRPRFYQIRRAIALGELDAHAGVHAYYRLTNVTDAWLR